MKPCDYTSPWNDGDYYTTVDLNGVRCMVFSQGQWIRVADQLAYLYGQLNLKPYQASGSMLYSKGTPMLFNQVPIALDTWRLAVARNPVAPVSRT